MQKLMESIYNAKMAKRRSGSGSLSPLMRKYLSSSSNSNSSSNSSSPLSRMSSNCNSPLSAVDEEDVFVMDGVLVSNDDFSRSSEEFGNSRFGTKGQLAHVKDELRSARFPIGKNKSEEKICKSYITGSCTYGSKCRFIHQGQIITDSAVVLSTTQMDSEGSVNTSRNSNAFKPEPSSKDNWSPEDEGIEVTLPTKPPGTSRPPSWEEVNEYIENVLYGPTAAKKRLPVFTEICPE